MKSFSRQLLACLLTFALGSGTVVFWLYYQTSRVTEIAPPAPLLASDCVKPENFPALARKISGIEKGKSDYFPKDIFAGGWKDADNFMNDWYGKHLRAMNEKSLLDVSDGKTEIYRFLWLRSFHHPVFVRVERSPNQIKLFTAESDGAGGYEPGKILRSSSRNLDQTEWCEFLKLLRAANYWNLPTNDCDLMGTDGAQWVLEGVRDNRYHIVDRWSPETGEYREACVYLLRLAGFEIDKLGDDLY
ncbi:MAG TPA: hypothetical protein VK400_00500 [Pyrinomonadaceae bacterium]|nr:hypothetical protein [Pyrinomonadaceae bacterium]